MREAAEAERFERAAALLRRRDRLAWVLERLDGVLRATHTAPRLVLAQHPVKERYDAFWMVQGRLVDWGPLPGPSELAERTEAALSRQPGRAPIPADEIDEVRIVASWIAEHEPRRSPSSRAGRRHAAPLRRERALAWPHDRAPDSPQSLRGRPRHARAFWEGVFELDVAMDMGWIATLASPANPSVQVSVFERGAEEGRDPFVSVEVTTSTRSTRACSSAATRWSIRSGTRIGACGGSWSEIPRARGQRALARARRRR